jgi:hypothetical protein
MPQLYGAFAAVHVVSFFHIFGIAKRGGSMSYEYTFFDGDSSASIVSDEALPHVTVGNVMRLEIGTFSQRADRLLVVERIEVYVYAPESGQAPERVRIEVYLRRVPN